MKHAARHRARRSQHKRAAQMSLTPSPTRHRDRTCVRKRTLTSSQEQLSPKMQEPHVSAVDAVRPQPFSRFFFAVSVMIACAVSIGLRAQLNFNTAYVDEADYLFVGRMLRSGHPWLARTYIFSSDLPLYFLGLGDHAGGVVGGRAISGLCGLISLYGFYRYTLLLFNDRQVALLAVLLLGIQAPHIFISKFATYDVICFAFFSLGLWVFVAACTRQEKSTILLGAGSGLIFFLAVMSKYIVLVYLPLLFGVASLLRRQVAWSFALCVMLLSIAYVCYNYTDLAVLYHNQIVSIHAVNATRAEILHTAGMYLAPLSALWGWALCRVYIHHALSSPTIQLLLFMTLALPLVGYHLKSLDMISMYKHVVYGAFFLCPVAALLFRDLLRRCVLPRFNGGFATCLLLVMTAIGFFQVKEMERAYADNRQILEWLLPRVDAQTTILSEDPYIFRHALFSIVPNSQIFEMTWFDNDMDGHASAQDVVDAIWDGKFDYVYLSDVIVPSLAKKLRTEVLPHKYEKVLDIPFSTSSVMTPVTTGSLSLYKSHERYQGLYPLNR